MGTQIVAIWHQSQHQHRTAVDAQGPGQQVARVKCVSVSVCLLFTHGAGGVLTASEKSSAMGMVQSSY